ncbi:MAG: hypothetical protein ABI675_20885 [Chitinophagaceae bacterium]
MMYFDYGLPPSWQGYYVVVYTLIEYLFFSYLISTAIIKKPLRFIMLFFSILFVIFQIVFDLTGAKLDSISIGIETILLFIYIIFFFYDHSSNVSAGYIYNHPIFWVSVGILLYLGVTFFFNILINYMTQEEIENYWRYTYFTEIFKNLFFAFAMLQFSHHHKLNPIRSSQVPYLDIDMS